MQFYVKKLSMQFRRKLPTQLLNYLTDYVSCNAVEFRSYVRTVKKVNYDSANRD